MMEHLLTIDHGNSSTTVGVFHKGLKEVINFDQVDSDKKDNISFVMSSSVGTGFKTWDGPRFITLKSLVQNNALLNMPINYSEQVGEDRLAGAYWVYKNWIQTRKAQKVMLVDAGTFTTLDLITVDGFDGGHIFPGTKTLLDSYSQAAKLPSLPVIPNTEQSGIPKSTTDAIYAAIQMAERGLYEKWWDKFRPDLIILSGGLAHWHKKYLPKESIYQEHIVHLGLYDAFSNMVR